MTTTQIKVFPNLYRDSVTLMQVSAALAARADITQASAVMASESNLDLLRAAGLLAGAADFGASDLLVAVCGEASAVAEALEAAEPLLTREASAPGSGPAQTPPRSIEMALAAQPASNLVLISTPGDYAAAEAHKALALGLNVMMFSDNVDIADEIALKQEAQRRGLLVMGPDCGTAIIDGVPLGFANALRRGAVGVVAASGTGLQQVTCLVDRRGQGISQAIGTGGRDLKSEVGGITMLRGLERLGADPATEVIVLVSKPPARAVAERILEAAARIACPVVVNFLGASLDDRPQASVHAAATLDEAAWKAVALAEGRDPAGDGVSDGSFAIEEADAARMLASEQQYVRGLYTGGTFCYEALLLLSGECAPVWSNTPVDQAFDIGDPRVSRGHTVVDLGDDEFTRGRPHPMIDLGLRNERIVAEAGDPGVAVILLDLVLGYGAHPDPGSETAAAIAAARARAAEAGRSIVFVASVCGTASDPQGLTRQEGALREAGVLLAESNAQAVQLAARIANRQPAAASTATETRP